MRLCVELCTNYSSAFSDGELFSEVAMRTNAAVLEYSRTTVSALSGATAGILGLTSLYGFAFYFLTSLMMTVRSFRTWKSPIHCIQWRCDVGLLFIVLWFSDFLCSTSERFIFCADPSSLENGATVEQVLQVADSPLQARPHGRSLCILSILTS